MTATDRDDVTHPPAWQPFAGTEHQRRARLTARLAGPPAPDAEPDAPWSPWREAPDRGALLDRLLGRAPEPDAEGDEDKP